MLYVPDPAGEEFDVNYPPKFMLDKSFVTLARPDKKLHGQLVRQFTDYVVYKYPSVGAAYTDMQGKSKDTYFLGDMSMGYNLTVPANRYGTLCHVSMTEDLYSSRMTYDALSVPKYDLSGHFYYGVDHYFESDNDFDVGDEYETYFEEL